jgi:amino acid transporter
MSGPAPGNQATGRDAGLVRAVGTFSFSAAIINGVVGAGIFSLPAAMATMAGHLAPLAFILCAIAMGAVVLCCAEASGRVATSGGTYGYADAAFGPLAGFVTGVLVWTSAVLSCGGIAAALVEGLTTWWPQLSEPLPRAAMIVAVVGGIGWINVVGVAPAARAITIVTVVKLVPLILLVLVGGIWLVGNGPVPSTPAPPTAFGQAVILALFAFSGMETPLAASGEVRDPARTIPRALILGMGGVTLLYIGIQIVTQNLLGNRLPGSSTPLADAISVVSAPLGIVLLLAASFSRFAWIGSDVLGAPRVLFAFARDGMLPGFLARVHHRHHTPHVAIWVHVIIAVVLAITGTFEQLAILAGLTTAGIYFMACSAAWVLHRRGVTGLGEAPRYRLLPYAAALSLIAMVVIIALGRWQDIAGLALLVVLSVLWFALSRRRGAASD